MNPAMQPVPTEPCDDECWAQAQIEEHRAWLEECAELQTIAGITQYQADCRADSLPSGVYENDYR